MMCSRSVPALSHFKRYVSELATGPGGVGEPVIHKGFPWNCWNGVEHPKVRTSVEPGTWTFSLAIGWMNSRTPPMTKAITASALSIQRHQLRTLTSPVTPTVMVTASVSRRGLLTGESWTSAEQ